MTEAPRFHRYKCRCNICGGYGDVCWEQVTKRGTKVLVVYRCSCAAGSVNYPQLAPTPGIAPSEPYTGTERKDFD